MSFWKNEGNEQMWMDMIKVMYWLHIMEGESGNGAGNKMRDRDGSGHGVGLRIRWESMKYLQIR